MEKKKERITYPPFASPFSAWGGEGGDRGERKGTGAFLRFELKEVETRRKFGQKGLGKGV